MRIIRSAFTWLMAALVAVALGYAVYVHGGGAGESVVRARGCVLCHGGWEQPLPMLRTLREGQAMRPLLEERLRRVHPLLSRGVEGELAEYLLLKQLPFLAQLRAGAPGQALYAAKCAACHGKDGMGSPGDYPPLRGSEWLTDEPSRLPEIISQGLRGPIEVRGEAWDKTMLPPGISSPEQVQQLIEYLRREFAAHPAS